MKNWTIEYKCEGEVFSVICFRNSYAASIIRALRKRRGVSNIVVIGLKDDNYMSPEDAAELQQLKDFSNIGG